jgi:arabinogalactan oligomer/maltooligosaccharide transport system permease protein
VRAIDLSRDAKEYLPRAKSTSASLWRSLLLLFLALTGASVVGAAGYLLVRLAVPTLPVYTSLVFGLVALITILRWMARAFEWIMPWYYVLPAILFLLTFTFFPVILTFVLAFTDYAGTRNGQLNIKSETRVLEVDGPLLTIENARNFVDDTTLTLEQLPPAGRSVLGVELYLPDLGFGFETDVVSADGTTLTLARAPPFPADLERITLRLDRDAVTRTMLLDEGDQITLNSPLPEGFEVEAIARYNDFGWVGSGNFRIILQQATSALIPIFTWNVLFAFATVLINTVAGVFLAVLLNNPDLRFKALYRTLLIVPWALPNIITLQVWRGFLNQNFGAVNRLLMLFDVTDTPINWLGEMWPARAAVLLVNLWLGLPFMMTATLGALSAIPNELYEAAKIDGANAWQGFWGVTAPLLRTALIPISLTGFAFNFNNFNVIFLLTDGGPPVSWGTATARGTDILISWAYNEAFRSQGGLAYGLGSAISIVIFMITIAVSLVNFRVTGALKEEPNT